MVNSASWMNSGKRLAYGVLSKVWPLWLLSPPPPRLKQSAWITEQEVKGGEKIPARRRGVLTATDGLTAPLASVAHVKHVAIFIRYRAAVLHRRLPRVRFNRQHMVLLDCPHSWHTDHYQYLQGGQCDLKR